MVSEEICCPSCAHGIVSRSLVKQAGTSCNKCVDLIPRGAFSLWNGRLPTEVRTSCREPWSTASWTWPRIRVNATRGYHTCDLCRTGEPARENWPGGDVVLGNAEGHVPGRQGDAPSRRHGHPPPGDRDPSGTYLPCPSPGFDG